MSADLDLTALRARFLRVRARTEALAAPLSPEDQQLQSQPSSSPTKWHRAHTTWFFETFALAPRGIAPVDASWSYLFNSYYEAVGPRHARPQRGLLSRPSCTEIAAYRRAVDARVLDVIDRGADPALAEVLALGLAHEEQHQELLLTDALHALAQHPFAPRYREAAPAFGAAPASALTFTPFDGGLVTIGRDAGGGFAFDNEGPAHRVWLEPFALADRLVTVEEARAFAADGGYRTPSLWLAEGWDRVRAQGRTAPAYVDDRDGAWRVFGLDGARAPEPAEPVAFVDYYEADAIARWLGARLPSEAEWEVAARACPIAGNTLADDPAACALRPRPSPGGALAQLFGDAWEWTQSSYAPYPGYVAAAGVLGEYNGKFMVNQVVLRGGSCFTPAEHLRATYRNFWPADTSFQVTGVRLARSP
ncbi:MAG: ergothioneine biosynthesis protein EgtB [Deltaproteobacteria bacterium]|nr:ergothioneine biosynthesis protein EgtB [Deltaproteobacteria bacterium]